MFRSNTTFHPREPVELIYTFYILYNILYIFKEHRKIIIKKNKPKHALSIKKGEQIEFF